MKVTKEADLSVETEQSSSEWVKLSKLLSLAHLTFPLVIVGDLEGKRSSQHTTGLCSNTDEGQLPWD